LIDPAVLRPGRIDRKIKVSRPDRQAAGDILRVYLTPDLPLDRSLLTAHGDDPGVAASALVEQVVDAIYRRTDQNRLLAVRLRSGQNKVLYRADLLSGAILASIVQRAKERAIDRSIRLQGEGTANGLTTADLLESIETEFREGEMLPPDDAAEEWLKLLDHHPDQVVGVSSYRRGRAGEERPVAHII
jgi:proteasome-associated ATPase